MVDPNRSRPAFLGGPVPNWIRGRRGQWRCRKGAFLAAVVSPRHRTAIDCQTRATRLSYCSALDPFAPFGTYDGRCPRAAAVGDRSHALGLTQQAQFERRGDVAGELC
jgi:hypothetical protein